MLKVGQVYLVAGTGSRDLHAVSDQAMFENTLKYAPEVGRYFDSQLVLMNVGGTMMAAEAATSPGGDSEAFAGFKKGMTQSWSGELGTITPNPLLSNDWKRERVATMIAVAPSAARYLDADVLAKLQQQASDDARQVNDVDLKSDLLRLASLLSRPPTAGRG